MMVHIQSSTGKCKKIISVILCSIILFCISCSDAYAFNGYTNFTDESKYWWNGSVTNPVYKYLGEYDLSANHEVNLYYQDSEKIDEILQAVYQQCLAWGITKNGAAAIVGNFKSEGAEPTITESYVDWDQFEFGKTGIGIMGFTWYSVQGDLFNTAHEMGKPWTDLGVQLKVLRDGYMHPDGDHAGQEEFYEEGHSLEELSNIFCAEYEKPNVNNFADRYANAQYYYNKFKDLPPKDYDGSLSSGGNNVGEVSTITGTSITKEWDLRGMPTESGLTADLQLPSLVGRDSLTTTEQYNLAQIGQSVAETKEFNAWTTARTVLVFIGLMLMVYTFILALCTLFDTVNSFLNISLVKLITLGAINYSNYDYKVLDGEDVKYTSGKRMVVLLIVMFVVGCIFVSGGVLPFVMQSIHSAMETVSSWV